MDNKGFIFSMDLLLALVIVTVAIGIASDQYALLNYQIQDFTGRQSLDKTTNDAADFLVKSSGTPTNWETNYTGNSTLPGLASMTTFGSNPNFLDPKKITTLDSKSGLIYNLLQTPNYNLKLVKTTSDTSSWPTLIDITSPYTPTVPLANAKEVSVANRTVVVLSNQTQFSINDLTHINPAHPAKNKGNLWYLKSGQSYFVGPGNVTTEEDNESSFYVSAQDLQNFDYYITIDENTGINVVQYGFTDGDAVVNGSYGDFSDKDRKSNVDGVLKDIYGGNGWLKLGNVNTGDLNNVNDELQSVIDNGGGPDMKIWLNIQSDPKDVISISLVKVFKGQAPFQRIPAKLVLTVWE